MIIRDAQNKDLESLAKLGVRLNKYEWDCDPKLKIKIATIKQTKKEFSNNLRSKNTKILVAEIEGNLIGYCIGSIEKPKHFNFKRLGYINSCFVDDKFRGKSIGKKLIGSMDDWFRKKRIKVVELGVLHVNISAKIWRKMGFQDYYIKMRKLI